MATCVNLNKKYKFIKKNKYTYLTKKKKKRKENGWLRCTSSGRGWPRVTSEVAVATPMPLEVVARHPHWLGAAIGPPICFPFFFKKKK
jgi:hypothetical protein